MKTRTKPRRIFSAERHYQILAEDQRGQAVTVGVTAVCVADALDAVARQYPKWTITGYEIGKP